jgi:hypothetical protein
MELQARRFSCSLAHVYIIATLLFVHGAWSIGLFTDASVVARWMYKQVNPLVTLLPNQNERRLKQTKDIAFHLQSSL